MARRSELSDRMGQEATYLREYPRVVGLLQGLLGSRIVAEELAQESFLAA